MCIYEVNSEFKCIISEMNHPVNYYLCGTVAHKASRAGFCAQ